MNERTDNNEIKKRIDDYVDGQLSANEIDELWVELIREEEYLNYLKNTANIKALSDQGNKNASNKTLKSKSWYYVAAAVGLLLVGVMAFYYLSDVNNAIEVEPVQTIELDYYRSANANPTAKNIDKVIQKAIQLANTGKVEKAVSLLQESLSNASNPKYVAKLSLNLGSLFYNRANYNKSVKYYRGVVAQKASIDKLMLEKTYWYLGNAYFHMDKLEIARKTIKKAYNMNGAYRRVAKSYLSALPK